MPPNSKDTKTYIDDRGRSVEINKVTYDRTDGKGEDKVTQIKVDGREIGHKTEHPDGTVNIHGNYYDNDKTK